MIHPGRLIGKAVRRLFSRRNSNRTGHKTEGKANSAAARKHVRTRSNSHKWGGPPRPMPKYRAAKRKRRAGNNA